MVPEFIDTPGIVVTTLSSNMEAKIKDCPNFFLGSEIFSHGQLYVPLSRVSDVRDLLVDKPSSRKGIVNVVHKAVFNKRLIKGDTRMVILHHGKNPSV